jgi:TonB family protein
MRFIGSFFGAVVVVSIMLAIGVRVFSLFEPERDGLVFHPVDLLSQRQQREWAGVLGLETGPGPLPALADIPPVEFRRTLQGFVQLELTLDAAGRVTAVDVLGSTLPPAYDQRAIDMVRARRYPAESGTAGALAGRRVEIVEFEMDPPAPASNQR